MSEATPGVPVPALAPTCYNHPDQVTYIHCARCRKPICTRCMNSASVGFQCPACIAGGTPASAIPRTIAGAPMRQGMVAATRPVVTFVLIGINVAAFLLQLAVGIDKSSTNWGMYPAGIAANGNWWTLLTSAFLHGSILHIAFNMYVLFALGPALERVLGHWRFTVLYLVAAFGGAVCSYGFSDPMTVSVGASGAIFGLMGALVVAGRRHSFDITQVVVLIGVNFAIGFMSPGIDWRAHLGGMITGAAVAAAFVYFPRTPVAQWGTVVAIVAVLLIMVVVRTSQLQAQLGALGPWMPWHR